MMDYIAMALADQEEREEGETAKALLERYSAAGPGGAGESGSREELLPDCAGAAGNERAAAAAHLSKEGGAETPSPEAAAPLQPEDKRSQAWLEGTETAGMAGSVKRMKHAEPAGTVGAVNRLEGVETASEDRAVNWKKSMETTSMAGAENWLERGETAGMAGAMSQPEGAAEALWRSVSGSKTLYQRLRQTTAAAEYRPSRGSTAPIPMEGRESSRQGLGELDRAFQRDARRYDGGFELY